MDSVLTREQKRDFLQRGFSRRNFGRIAAMITAGAALPFYNEPALAQLSARNIPPDAVKIDANENPLGPCPEAAEAIHKIVAQGGRYLYGETGKFDRAAAVLGELAAVPELPRDLKYEAKLAETAALIRAGTGPAADGILDGLERDQEFAGGPLKERLAVLRLAAKLPKTSAAGKPPEAAKLEEAIAAAKDPLTRGLGYNFLGDLYAAAGQNRDAMWSYLWVDTVYNQDRDEQVVAVRRLVELMEKAGDKDRADQFRDKLARIR